jgi:hypothetical protein
MLNKVGLLPKDNEELVCSGSLLFQLEESDFYLGPVRVRFVQANRQTRLRQSRSFKETFCKSVEIEFVSIPSVPKLRVAQTSILAWCLVRRSSEIDYSCIQYLLGTR